MYRIDFDDVSERLQFISSRLVTRRLCIEMTELQNYRHSVNTFDHTFYSLDSYCESFCISSHAKHTNLRCLPFRKKNDLIISALPPLQRQALNRLLVLSFIAGMIVPASNVSTLIEKDNLGDLNPKKDCC